MKTRNKWMLVGAIAILAFGMESVCSAQGTNDTNLVLTLTLEQEGYVGGSYLGGNIDFKTQINCNSQMNYTWDFPNGQVLDGADVTQPFTEGFVSQTVYVTAQNVGGSVSTSEIFSVTAVGDIHYKFGELAYTSMPSSFGFFPGGSVSFKAIISPATNATWPGGKPAWGGSAGGSTEEITIQLSDTSTNLSAECGNVVEKSLAKVGLIANSPGVNFAKEGTTGLLFGSSTVPLDLTGSVTIEWSFAPTSMPYYTEGLNLFALSPTDIDWTTASAWWYADKITNASLACVYMISCEYNWNNVSQITSFPFMVYLPPKAGETKVWWKTWTNMSTFASSNGRWWVEHLDFRPDVSNPVYFITNTSAFFPKAQVHEEKHYNDAADEASPITWGGEWCGIPEVWSNMVAARITSSNSPFRSKPAVINIGNFCFRQAFNRLRELWEERAYTESNKIPPHYHYEHFGPNYP